MIDWHKRQLELWKYKIGVSEYGILWIAFAKGIVFGFILYYFGVAA